MVAKRKRKTATKAYRCEGLNCGVVTKRAKTSKGSSTTLKLCQACYNLKKVDIFYSSSFALKLKRLYARQPAGTVLMTTDDIIELHRMYLEKFIASGTSYDTDEGWLSEYEFELAHLDPRSNENFTGMLHPQNIAAVPKALNRSLSNHLPLSSFGYRAHGIAPTAAPMPFKEALKDVDLVRVVDECKLVATKNAPMKAFPSRGYLDSAVSLERTLTRLRIETHGKTLPLKANGKRVDFVYELLLRGLTCFIPVYINLHGTVIDEKYKKNPDNDSGVAPLSEEDCTF